MKAMSLKAKLDAGYINGLKIGEDVTDGWFIVI